MKFLCLSLAFILSAAVCFAENESPQPKAQEPKLYDHYLALQHMQQALSKRSLEDQTRLQPQMQRAERQACQRLRQEREERVSRDEYRRQGGDQFVAFTQQFEQYCETLR